jgi:hypothetical protein
MQSIQITFPFAMGKDKFPDMVIKCIQNSYPYIGNRDIQIQFLEEYKGENLYRVTADNPEHFYYVGFVVALMMGSI